MRFPTDLEERHKIDKYLAQQEHDATGKQVFRLVWSTDRFEFREGTFNEFQKSTGLFLRSVYGIHKRPKYSYLPPCWILEMLHPMENVQTKEIKDHDGYECFFAFVHNYKPLPLRLIVVELKLKAAKLALDRSYMLAKSELQNQVNAVEEKAYKETYDMIDPSSPIESALHFREGVSYSGLKIPEFKNYDSTTKFDESCTSKSGK